MNPINFAASGATSGSGTTASQTAAPTVDKKMFLQLLVAGREVPVMQDGSRLSVTVPAVRDLEVVAVDL